MGHKKSRKKRQPREELTSATSPRQPAPAQDAVFATYELVDEILQYLDDSTLLSNTQRVCKRFRDVIALRTRHYFQASRLQRRHWESHYPDAKSARDERLINPLLAAHFGAIFDQFPNQCKISRNPGPSFVWVSKKSWHPDSYITRGALLRSHRHSKHEALRTMSIATKDKHRATHRAFARTGASWRQMQVCNPPIYELQYRDCTKDDDDDNIVVVPFPDGLCMGPLYDLITYVVTEPRELDRREAQLTWPLLVPQRSSPASLQRSTPVDNTGHVAPELSGQQPLTVVVRASGCGTSKYYPSNREACCGEWCCKYRRRYFNSSKWMLRCDEYDGEQLFRIFG